METLPPVSLVKYEAKPLMLGIHIFSAVVSLGIIIFLLSILGNQFGPMQEAFLTIVFTLSVHLFWTLLILLQKSHLLTGNQWLKCSPYLLIGIGNVILTMLWPRDMIFIIVFLPYSLACYVNMVMTSWWKPFRKVVGIPEYSFSGHHALAHTTYGSQPFILQTQPQYYSSMTQPPPSYSLESQHPYGYTAPPVDSKKT